MISFALALLTLALCVASLLTGHAQLTLADLQGALTGMGDPLHTMILIELRLPRALLGVLVGGSLGLCGAAMQGYLRNPLASPDLTGTASSAALGPVLVLVGGLAGATSPLLPLAAILGSLGATAALRIVTGPDPRPTILLLGGVAISTFAAAAVSATLSLSSNPFAILEATFWLLGSFSDRSFLHVAMAAPGIVLGCAMIYAQRNGLDALTLGEDTARSLGINMARMTRMLVIGVALAIGSGVAVAGVIGFIGLIVPHLVRPLVGYTPSRTLVPSFLAGACLALGADLVVRLVPSSGEIKIGVITAIIGLPFFLFLLGQARRRSHDDLWGGA